MYVCEYIQVVFFILYVCVSLTPPFFHTGLRSPLSAMNLVPSSGGRQSGKSSKVPSLQQGSDLPPPEEHEIDGVIIVSSPLP